MGATTLYIPLKRVQEIAENFVIPKTKRERK